MSERARYAPFTPDTCSPDTSCIHLYSLVSGYKLLVRDTCIWLHVSDVNAALDNPDTNYPI